MFETNILPMNGLKLPTPEVTALPTEPQPLPLNYFVCTEIIQRLLTDLMKTYSFSISSIGK